MSLLRERTRRAFRKAFGRRFDFRIGQFDVALTPDHLLPIHQAANPRYDRFLPHLASFLGASDAVVDERFGVRSCPRKCVARQDHEGALPGKT